MKKIEAIQAFGNGSKLGRAIGRTKSVISRWPEELDQHRADLVRGAAWRLRNDEAHPNVTDVLDGLIWLPESYPKKKKSEPEAE